MKKGKVYLVGAGPGDPGLLTVKALHLIKNAQVVIYDKLVGIQILNFIPQEAKKIDVGKLPDNHPVPQDEINKIILREAMNGAEVVRLKGGDPFVFGRGGEELELLVENNVEFEVVPGITSAIAVPSYAGIPVTHRDFCSSLHIFTGHSRSGKELKISYESAVETGGTLLFLMGVSALSEICSGLLTAGMRGDMPAAVVERGTTKFQRKVIATLETLADAAMEQQIKNPAVIIIGEVCSCATRFDWFTKKPLFGKRIVVTRPKEVISEMSEKIREIGGEALEFPCIETRPLPLSKEETKVFNTLQEYSWVVLTSAFGVNTLMDKLKEHHLDVRALHGLKIAVIGKGTAKAFHDCLIQPNFMPETYDVRHLAEEILPLLTKQDKLLMLRAKEGSKAINDIFDKQGICYKDFPIYETGLVSLEHSFSREIIENMDFDAAVFTSASTVSGFVAALKNVDFSKVTAVCIGKETAEMAKKHHMNIIISKEATIDSVVEALKEI